MILSIAIRYNKSIVPVTIKVLVWTRGCMKAFLTLFLLSSALSFLNQRSCLEKWMTASTMQYPSYRCVFSRSSQSRVSGEWRAFKTLYCGLYSYKGLCARPDCLNCTFQLMGDGGKINWIFDGSAFRKQDKLLFLISKFNKSKSK